MTGNAFLKRLMFQLDFLGESDRKTVLGFYEKKLAEASTLLEEEDIVKSFGSPEHIAEKLKEAFLRQTSAGETDEHTSQSGVSSVNEEDSNPVCVDVSGKEATEPKTDTQPDNETSDKKETESEVESEPELESEPEADSATGNSEGASVENVADDLIFSKPATVEKAPEVIHSMEDKESKPLFGEKVLIRDRVEPIEEFSLEAIDEENGLTSEEIEAAKAETLEKANKFRTEGVQIPDDMISVADMAETEAPEDTEAEFSESDLSSDPPMDRLATPIEELEPESKTESDTSDESGADNQIASGDDKDAMDENPPGLINRLFPSLSPKGSGVLTVFLSILLSPILLVLFASGLIVYFAATLVTVLFSLVLFVLIAALIVLGVIELVYGIAMLFDTVSVALIEIGVGTVLFALVIAVAALIYEFFFGVLPKGLKLFTKLLKGYWKRIYTFLYGGKA